MAVKSGNYPSVSWADTLDIQRSALRWDVKRAMKSLCSKLEEIGEECFVVTVNVSNGWVGHLGTIRGNEYIDEKSHILYDFLNYCAESLHGQADVNGEREDNSSSDTESGIEDINDKREDNTPITISRPPRSVDEDTLNHTEAFDKDDHVVEVPERYINKHEAGKKLRSVQTPTEQFVLLSPADIQNVTQKVLETEYQQTEKISALSVPQLMVPQKEKSRGKKRKQSIVAGFKKEDREPESTEKKHHKNKEYRDESKDSRETSEANEHNVDEQKNIREKAGSNEGDSEDVSENIRVLRSSRSQGRKKDSTAMAKKEKALSKDDEDDSEGEDDMDWNDDIDEDEDYVADDVNDEDWDIELDREMVGRANKRDNLGRYLSGSRSKKSRSGRKQKPNEVLEGNSKEAEKSV